MINLKSKYPELFEFCEPTTGCGWNTIIDELCNKLPNDFRFLQIKEKFGVLRIYFKAPTNYESCKELVYEVEQKSANLCEYCGKLGEERLELDKNSL